MSVVSQNHELGLPLIKALEWYQLAILIKPVDLNLDNPLELRRNSINTEAPIFYHLPRESFCTRESCSEEGLKLSFDIDVNEASSLRFKQMLVQRLKALDWNLSQL